MFQMLAEDEALMRLIQQGELIPLVAIVFGCLTAMVAIIATKIASVAKNREIERTRRELAAYVAEGSIDADKAIALMGASQSKAELECLVGRKS